MGGDPLTEILDPDVTTCATCGGYWCATCNGAECPRGCDDDKKLEMTVETCDYGHKFSRFVNASMPYRCPECLTVGFESLKRQLDDLEAELERRG